ncbi:MAG: MFS transporter [Gammaproteobacteria bacterium]|nr:MFS transporter [Gammaproteobacteria bacterium]|tara:strand:- start:2343 stop:3611 length:1269 start_codon:yes stop_codon:yes gene_type:complete
MINKDTQKIISLAGFGFASGLPYVLIFITLTAWLRDAGIDLSLIGFISWIMLTYSVKFLWAPFVDRSPTKLFKKFGHRRSWIITMQLQIIISLVVLSFINPLTNLIIFALFAFNIALAGSIQDIAIDAYRIESAKLEDQGNLAAGYQFGYRIAILVGSSFALIYAENFSWSLTYQLMAILMSINIFISIYISSEKPNPNHIKLSYQQSLIEPIKDFFERFGLKMASILLLIIATYRLTDIVMGPMANPFYIDMGYSLSEIGYVVKIVALIATIIGVFIGGIFIKRYGLYKSLLVGAFLVMFTNLCFSYAAINEKNLILLSTIVASDSLAAGIVGTVNITFLTSLVSSKYTGFQYALLTSLMAFLGKVFGGFSGVLVENFQNLYGFNYGWMSFYIFTSFLAIPAIVIIFLNKNFFIIKNVKNI